MLNAPARWLFDIDQPNSKIECIVGIGGLVWKNAKWMPSTSHYDEDGALLHLGTKWFSGVPLNKLLIHHVTGESFYNNQDDESQWVVESNHVDTDPLLKSSPSFGESIDVMSKIFTTTSIKLDFVNSKYHGQNFSDWAVENSVVGKKTLIYFITFHYCIYSS